MIYQRSVIYLIITAVFTFTFNNVRRARDPPFPGPECPESITGNTALDGTVETWRWLAERINTALIF